MPSSTGQPNAWNSISGRAKHAARIECHRFSMHCKCGHESVKLLQQLQLHVPRSMHYAASLHRRPFLLPPLWWRRKRNCYLYSVSLSGISKSTKMRKCNSRSWNYYFYVILILHYIAFTMMYSYYIYSIIILLLILLYIFLYIFTC